MERNKVKFVFALVFIVLASSAFLWELGQFSISYEKQNEEVIVLQISRRANYGSNETGNSDAFGSKAWFPISGLVESITAPLAQEPVSVEYPPACTAQQLETILHQLPDRLCKANQKRPWNNLCSFSFATSCPEAVWIDEYYKNRRPNGESFVAIYVGCNKGMDAVNALRMGSVNPFVDKQRWRNVFYANASNVQSGVCRQEQSEQFPVQGDSVAQPATVHCLEAMPNTAKHLQQTVAQFDWKDQFIVKNAALSSTDGVTRFSSGDVVGYEKSAICQQNSRGNANCKEVPLIRLDTYLQQHQNTTSPHEPIDLLSIDVEGYDAEVLLGAQQTLDRVRYLEFEYNWRGLWKSHSLQNVTQRLRDRGFVCYWPGMGGHIWRITDCWLSHYRFYFWSNVACVHPERHPFVAKRMEQLFQETLAQGTSIQYSARVPL